jgi:phosphoribosylanthranilate isomerase
MTRIKICCIANSEEASIAKSLGADAIGLVSEMPSGPGMISEFQIKQIIKKLPPFVIPVLLTSKNRAVPICDQVKYCRPRAVQLCEPLDESELKQLTQLIPGIPLIRVIHVSGQESVEEAKTYESYVNGLLLDTGQRSGPAKQLGGTGKTHDWFISAEIVKSVNVPVILAGGLNPQNVKQAVKYVKPYAVDVCSGVRSNGQLDSAKLYQFISAVRGEKIRD